MLDAKEPSGSDNYSNIWSDRIYEVIASMLSVVVAELLKIVSHLWTSWFLILLLEVCQFVLRPLCI